MLIICNMGPRLVFVVKWGRTELVPRIFKIWQQLEDHSYFRYTTEQFRVWIAFLCHPVHELQSFKAVRYIQRDLKYM